MTNQPRIDQLVFGIAAGAGDVTGVVHTIAGREAAHRCTDCVDRAGGIVAKHLRPRLDLRLGRTNLGIDRIDRHRLDAHQQVMLAGHRLRQLDIEQGGLIIDRQVMGQCDGFHEELQGHGE